MLLLMSTKYHYIRMMIRTTMVTGNNNVLQANRSVKILKGYLALKCFRMTLHIVTNVYYKQTWPDGATNCNIILTLCISYHDSLNLTTPAAVAAYSIQRNLTGFGAEFFPNSHINSTYRYNRHKLHETTLVPRVKCRRLKQLQGFQVRVMKSSNLLKYYAVFTLKCVGLGRTFYVANIQ